MNSESNNVLRDTDDRDDLDSRFETKDVNVRAMVIAIEWLPVQQQLMIVQSMLFDRAVKDEPGRPILNAAYDIIGRCLGQIDKVPELT